MAELKTATASLLANMTVYDMDLFSFRAAQRGIPVLGPQEGKPQLLYRVFERLQ